MAFDNDGIHTFRCQRPTMDRAKIGLMIHLGFYLESHKQVSNIEVSIPDISDLEIMAEAQRVSAANTACPRSEDSLTLSQNLRSSPPSTKHSANVSCWAVQLTGHMKLPDHSRAHRSDTLE